MSEARYARAGCSRVLYANAATLSPAMVSPAGRECRWDWKVQSSSKLWNGKELFSPLTSSKRYFFVVWCDDRIRSATPGDVPEFEILESVHSDGEPVDEGPGPCTKSLKVSISIAPNLIWPLGVDFSLPHCGKALYGKIKSLVNNVFKKKEGQPEVNPDTGELVAASANTTAHLNEAASEVTAAETETEGTDSGITDAGGVAACKKLDIIGSVLIDASMLMPIITFRVNVSPSCIFAIRASISGEEFTTSFTD